MAGSDVLKKVMMKEGMESRVEEGANEGRHGVAY
jgi:hypothetical protein